VNSTNTTAVDGFILTRQWLETDQGIDLVFWLATNRGPARLSFTEQEAVCFFPERQKQLLATSLRAHQGWRVSPTKLKDFKQQPVTALYARSRRLLLDVSERLRSRGVFLLENDIKPTDRFLMERFITGGLSLKATEQQTSAHSSFVDYHQAAVKPCEYRPKLKALSIDIETDYRAEALYSIAAWGADCAVVLMLAPEQQEDLLKSAASEEFELRCFNTEAELLLGFVHLLADVDPDVLIGWNVVNFDLRCLQNFADRAGVELLLGRAQLAINWRQARDNKDRHYVLVPGRAILDGIELLRSATYAFENFSLEYVAQQLLQRGKLIDDVDQRGAEITTLFETNKLALARYNLEDCRLVWDIFEQEKLIDFAIERSLLTGLELDRYGGSVAAMDFLYLPRLHRKGYVAPAIGQQQSDNLSPGGYVMESVPGIHDFVAVLDFKSLYPSIIRTFHVDPLALIEGLAIEDAIPGYDGGAFSRDAAILPELIETLWSARDRAKQQANKELSQAIKIIMNSFYGVLGTSACRFLDTRLVSSITKRGHQIIIDSKEQIEAKGYQVIYGDTDSVFVLMTRNYNQHSDEPKLDGQCSIEQAQSTARWLADELNTWWKEKLENEFGICSYLEMEFETLFTRFLMPTVRGSDAGSKKRYAGVTADGQLVFKGLESVRSDWSPLAREFQQELYRRLFAGEPYQDYVQSVVQKLRDGEDENQLLLRKRLRRRLEQYVKNVPPHVQAARKAESIRAERNLPPLYESGGWIEYLITVNGPEPKQYRQSPIDIEFYIEKQLAPIADSILLFEGTSLEQLLTQQIGLF